jgi:hypothetical protein
MFSYYHEIRYYNNQIYSIFRNKRITPYHFHRGVLACKTICKHTIYICTFIHTDNEKYKSTLIVERVCVIKREHIKIRPASLLNLSSYNILIILNVLK